jgi:mRNA-degrading endonuclease RelE of RelBE toxin-antitoxin system
VDKDVTEFSEYSDALAISNSEYPVDPVYLSIRKKLGKSTITRYKSESFRLLTEPVYILNP